ncbi:E3 ubiquitin-protein ligase RNF26-like [Brachionichthys hirsutus]|uniref:E3 ubiquitin-protein ligase RNF26-like n=1 Tax=Brachionichthys hirsutus TaxID=412623 RepID=UPI0036042FCE
MDEVNFACLAVGSCVDGVFLLLDLVTGPLGWLLRLLSGAGASLHVLLAQYWNVALLSFLTASEAVSGAACGALHAADDWIQKLGGVFESFKMVGHLCCHVAWRTKDVLHRGLVSASCVLRQTLEGLCIGLSLVLYFFNTLVNLVLISTQNCLSGLAGVWGAVAEPVHRAAQLALTLLTFLYSCLVGASVLLWASCQLLLDFLGGLGRVFFTVVMVDSHGLLITAAIVCLMFLLLSPRLPVLARRFNPLMAIAAPGARSVRISLHSRPATLGDAMSVLAVNERDSAQRQPFQDVASASGTSSRLRSSPAADGGRVSDAELLGLLKEQEERKKCVICQDVRKTVLLLPCRHLCLCRHCADILTQRRHVQQRCCPLCREPISQAMDVFL